MPEAKKFTHLHVHTEYSLLDGSAKIEEVIARAKELGMDSIAITDHGVMYGVIDFYKEAVANGIKPVLGCEVYVASGSRFNRNNERENFYYHLVLLAENNTGYHNLIKLVSAGFTEGFYYKPRIDVDLLRKYSEGLIALSACMSGSVAKTLLNISYAKAMEQALLYDEIMGRGNFYLELQNHGLQDQLTVNPLLIKLSKETGIPLVATNDMHYISKDDAKPHELLLCIQTGKTIDDDDRMKYEGDQFYLKSSEEMYDLFPYAQEACENTNKIADRCNVTITFNQYKLPKFELPENVQPYDYLRQLTIDGLKYRYGDSYEDYIDRLNYELTTIKNMGFVDYFLITWDFIKYAKDHGIPVGPGRGSSAGSIVCYALRITDIDPIRHNLVFERFLNPERVTMPDIDMDFCYERRQEVIDYVIKKYQADHVAQIITFGTMAAKAVIRDVGRALAMPYADVDRIAKMVPFGVGLTLTKAMEMNPELQKAYDEEDDTKYLIDMSLRLEGLPRHASTHAAGVVICDKPVNEYVPLNQNDGVITTQFPMTTVEELGLLKMDFLGLRTLTVIQHAIDEIKRNQGITIDLDKFDYKDKKVFELISQAKTEGVFQLESSGMKSFMKDLQPESLDDIIAGIALYRPGPMDSIPKYVNSKNKNAAIEYLHESLKPILNTTYGCIVYQEQVMQIVRDLAGYSYGRSDLVRRAMSKKKAEIMRQERQYFIYGLGDSVPGCLKNGIPLEAANQIFDDMVDFAAYAFPKGHAAAYAVIGYQTAWLKVYYPVEFMAALMTSVMGSSGKIAEYIEESKKMGIKLLPPDINESYSNFGVSGSSIRFGLSAIKNVGRSAIDAIVKERDKNGRFKGLTDFINRLEGRDINKRCVESLIKAGVFDQLGGKRNQYMYVYKNIMDGITKTRKANVAGQMSLFDMIGGPQPPVGDELPNMNEYSQKELLNYEKEVLGIYVSGHPLSQYEQALSKHVNASSLDFIFNEDNNDTLIKDGADVCVGGIITAKSIKYTKNNEAMAFVTLEDLYGTIEVIVFSKTYKRYMEILQEGTVIVVNGRASVKEDEDARLISESIKSYNEFETESMTLWLKIAKDANVSAKVVTSMLALYKGQTPVAVYYEESNKKIRLQNDYWVTPSEALLDDLKNYLGDKSVVLK